MTTAVPPDQFYPAPPPSLDELEAESVRLQAFEMERDANVGPEPIPLSSKAVGQRLAVIYIDADNQSPQLAGPLLDTLADTFGVNITDVMIAGNNSGRQVDCWCEQLSAAAPALSLQTLHVPAQKEAADIALMLALGANLDRHFQQQELVIILSRDELLNRAGEQASDRGIRVLLAYADSNIPNAGNSRLSTILLPAVNRATVGAGKEKKPAPPDRGTPEPAEAPAVNKNSIPSVLAALRKMCPEQPGGGYSATHVGQSLAKLDFDQKGRKAFLKSVPNLGTRGSGAHKVLIF